MAKRVLIIDDEENIRRVTRITLEAAGYEAGEVGDGEQGLEAFGDGAAWDAVLLDQKMPGMDGLEVLRRLKERRTAVPVIMITAFASIELAVDAMKLGATDFVRKPMTPEIVRNAVRAALSKAASAISTPPGSSAPDVPSRPLIDTVTLNGFHILRPSDVGDDTPDEKPQEKNQRRFIVMSPSGTEYKVTVRIEDESVGYVERMTRRRLPPENSFWTQRAERTLAEYLWSHGGPPPDGRLTVGPLDRDQLAMAERWTGN
jgi:DNA-binding response OmpR family regulator